MMQELKLVQGSDDWLAHRRTHRNASDTPSVTGSSNYKSRSAFIKERATGIVPDVDPATQKRFNDGHRYEALARPLMEKIIGEDLFQKVGVDGLWSASFDGLTMMDDINAEHKTLNDLIRSFQSSADIHPMYIEQCEHQMMVSGSERTLFMATKWNKAPGEEVEEGKVYGKAYDESGILSRYVLQDEKHFWIEANPELRKKIVAAWKQFDIDVANYQPEEKEDPVIATVVKDLPSVMVQVSGSVAIIDNFALFEQALRDFIENRLIRKPKTDQDFADLTVQIKSLKKAEDALDSAEEQMIAQVQSVSDMKRTKDMLHKMARDNRLVAEKLLKEEKDNRKRELLAKASADLSSYAKLMFDRAGVPIPCSADFAGAIKGLSSIESMEEKLGAALRNAQHEANLLADLVEANRKTVEDMSLVPDFHLVCMKPKDDFAALLSVRINQRKEAEEKRLNEEREKIRAEEQAKAQQEIKAAVEQIAVIVTPEQVCVSESAKSDTQAALSITDDMQSTAKPRPDDKTGPRVTSLRIQISGELEKMNVYQLADVLAYCQVLPTRNKIAA
jgi:predicted phage-related endonuclease